LPERQKKEDLSSRRWKHKRLYLRGPYPVVRKLHSKRRTRPVPWGKGIRALRTDGLSVLEKN